ncbi:hypothetical protein COSO111634_20855 [Corallococcus soli]
MTPGKRAGSTPASSSAAHAHWRNNRCCGSVHCASRSDMSKKAGSNSSMSASTPCAGTKPGCCHSSTPGGRPGWCSSSSGWKREMDSTPSRRFFQNSSTDAAPGKRPDMPMMAMAPDGSVGAGAFSGVRADASGAVPVTGVAALKEAPDADDVSMGAAPAFAPSRSRRSASAWTVGCSNSQTTGTSRWSASRSRLATRTTVSDVPPRSSKKWSWTPMRWAPSSRAQTDVSRSSSGFPGSTKRPLRAVEAASGSGRACRSTLPLGVSGSAATVTNAVGTMYSGSRWRRCSRRAWTSSTPATAGTT